MIPRRALQLGSEAIDVADKHSKHNELSKPAGMTFLSHSVPVNDDHVGLKKAIAHVLSEGSILVVRIFPTGASCLRLIRALAVETHGNWIKAHRYLDMALLKESKKQALLHMTSKIRPAFSTFRPTGEPDGKARFFIGHSTISRSSG